MARTSSTGSNHGHLQRTMTNLPGWPSVAQDSTTGYSVYSEASMRKQAGLQPIAEYSTHSADSLVDWSPDEYITSCIEPASSSSLPFSFPQHPSQMHLQLTPNWGSTSDISTSPSTPSTALMTPVTHSSNPMSRQSSYNPLFFEDNSMLRVQSDSSYMHSILEEDGCFSFGSNVQSKVISNCADDSLFPTFTGPASEAFFVPVQSASASDQALAPSENDKLYLAADMRRSTSLSSSDGSASDASAPSSICSRQSRRQREINAQTAARKIAPKATDLNDETESASSNAQMARIRSEDGSSKALINKTPYMRPQHPKIMCQYCSERPEGFRGTHELDRHIARAHAPSRKGYICVDYWSDKKYLASCKHCRNKKVYGAYYNAAAHLRRAHFYPRKRGRKGKNDEKRGGIGGGDDPPMDYLKMHWIKEVEVANKPKPSSPDSGSDDGPEPDNTYDATYDIDTSASYASHQPAPSPLNMQMPIDAGQYTDYDLSMHSSEPMIYGANTLAAYGTNVAATNDISSFEFDAYMAQ
jgi:hypothetical protein